MNATIDTSGLNARLAEFQRALVGIGAGADGLSGFLRNEAGNLAWDIGEKLGPRTKTVAKTQLDKELKNSFYVYSGRTNLKPEQQFSKFPAFTWLYASPMALVGFEDRYDARDEDLTSVLRRHYKIRKDFRPRWGVERERGQQHIRKIQKTIVLKKQQEEVRNFILTRVGQSRAAFARTASELIPNKRIPQWVRQQIESVKANGKSIFLSAGLQQREQPFVEFGSRAKGVQSNPYMREAIQFSINRRERLIAAKIKKVLAGFTYDWNTGQIFRAPKTEDN